MCKKQTTTPIKNSGQQDTSTTKPSAQKKIINYYTTRKILVEIEGGGHIVLNHVFLRCCGRWRKNVKPVPR